MSRARWLVFGLVLALMAASTVGMPPAAVSAPQSGTPLAAASVPVWPMKSARSATPAMPAWHAPGRLWPVAGSQAVTLKPVDAGEVVGSASPGGLPVTVRAEVPPVDEALVEQRLLHGGEASAAAVQVEVFDQSVAARANVTGVMLAVKPTAGLSRLGVELDYRRMAGGFGGDWGGRLRLVTLPSCALSTPELAACQVQTPLAGSTNDRFATAVSADLDLAARESAMVLALTASGSSEVGDWSATSLAATASWAQGGSSGDFSYSVPVQLPDVPGGLKPQVAFGYSSGSLDGKTKAANAQSSIVGDGWDMSFGFVERTYQSCAKDGRPASNAGDWCWTPYLPLSIVLNGKSTRILWDAAAGWKTEDDSLGWRFESLTGASNGVHQGQYWKVTTTDGTQYFFGWAPRWSENVSTQRAIVYGNNVGEPCYNASFSSAQCWMGYRWNLDRVVDVHGNAIDYKWGWYYQGKYGANNNTNPLEYDLAAHPYQILYGGNLTLGTPHVARVEFAYEYRCLSDRTTCDAPGNAHLWPDSPRDQYCALTASSCPGLTWQAFWTPWRLAKVSTRVSDGGSGWLGNPTSEVTLGHSFPSSGDWMAPAGDDTPPALWMQTLTVSGRPAMNFYGTLMGNRVQWGASINVPPMTHYRMGTIDSGTGQLTNVTYHGQDCNWNDFPAAADMDNNTRRCYPAHKEGSGWVWYHKHMLASVTTVDNVGGGPGQRVAYDYSTWGSSTPVLWHFDTNTLATDIAADRTWNVWRGFPTVRTTEQAADGYGPVKVTESTYYRGMHGDRTDAGWNSRSATVTDFNWEQANDDDALAGQLRYSVVFDGLKLADGSNWSTLEIHRPTATQTGVQAASDGSQVRAMRVREPSVSAAQRSTAGARWTETTTTFDSYGRPTKITDHGDVSTIADNLCTITTYTQNTTAWLIEFPVQQTKTRCVANPTIDSDYFGGTRYFYDGLTTAGQIGAKGLVTRTEALKAVSGTTLTWQQATRAAYDGHGRTKDSWDALDRKTSTAYTPLTGGPVTKVATTGPMGAGWTTTVTLDARMGVPTQIQDINNKKTSATYDNFGRLTSVWKNNRPTTQTPDIWHGYWLRGDGPSLVHTKTLGSNGNQINSYQLLDGLLRPRQTHTESATGTGRTIVDTAYNGRGQVAKTSTFYNGDVPGAGSVLVGFADKDIKVQQRQLYDNLGRTTKVQRWTGNGVLTEMLWQTATTYDGQISATTTPPAGGVTTTTVTDIRGSTVQLRQHGGLNDTTTYRYDQLQRLTGVTDGVGNSWTYKYNLLGQKYETIDPDAGTSSTEYDAAGQVKSTTDGRGQKLFYEYDNLGRKTKLRADTANTGALLADWTYDTVYNGQPGYTRRYSNGNTYTSAVTSYDEGYRPLTTTDTVPGFGPLGAALTYTTTHTYKADGALATTKLPAVANLPEETLSYGYTGQGLLDTVTSGQGTYVADTFYDYDGVTLERRLGASGAQVRLTNQFDAATRRLQAQSVFTGGSTAQHVYDYAYDPAGNITNAGTITNGVRDQMECFRYDHLRRLYEAWVQPGGGSGCVTPQRSGADPYWRQWTFDTIGNRKTQTDKGATPADDTVWTYKVGTEGAVKPHQVKEVTATGPLAGSTRAFTYDPAGNTLTRTTDTGAAQVLGWDKEGHLGSVTENNILIAKYVYDTNGRRLLAENPATGLTTLYLSDGTEIEKAGAGSLQGKRYYPTAVRDGGGVKWAVANHQGTSTIQIHSATLTTARRRFMPFGEPRGQQPAGWLGTKTFVDGTKDHTGLTHLGAREYDPGLGRFVSVDPLMDLTDPQQWHAYSYASSSPVTNSDPDGMREKETTEKSGGGAAPKSGCMSIACRDKTPARGTDVLQPVTPNIYLLLSDPHFELMKQAYNDYIANTSIKDPGNVAYDTEIEIMRQLCNYTPGLCSAEMTDQLNQMSQFYPLWTADGGLAPLFQNGALAGMFRLGPRSPRPQLRCGGHSFAPHTKVLLADGSVKEIKDIGVGDRVVAADPLTGQAAPKPVTNLHVHQDEQLTLLTVADSSGQLSTVETTHGHLFWSDTQDDWVQAGALQVGDQLTSVTGKSVAVAKVANYLGDRAMHDLTVADLHTYYVLAGQTPVLVHNAGCLNLPADGPLGQQITKVVNYWDKTGKTPPGVMQGGAPGYARGVFLNSNKLLPKRPLGYYTESDVWATGGVNRGADRLIFGKNGEVYYTGDHYKTFIQVR